LRPQGSYWGRTRLVFLDEGTGVFVGGGVLHGKLSAPWGYGSSVFYAAAAGGAEVAEDKHKLHFVKLVLLALPPVSLVTRRNDGRELVT
jgi:hypothetical protein